MKEGQVRSALAGLLFTGDDIYKKVSDISGGESARLQLAILSQTFNNVLMMDEPTNHLDMMSREILENGFWDTELSVRPRWEDGTPAHTVKKFGIVNRYDLKKEFPILTIRYSHR